MHCLNNQRRRKDKTTLFLLLSTIVVVSNAWIQPFLLNRIIPSSSTTTKQQQEQPLFATAKEEETSTTGSAVALNDEIAELMSKHDPILLFASRILPRSVAADASALYAWCRRLDEITDGGDEEEKEATRAKLDDWKTRLDLLWEGKPVDGMDAALADCVRRRRNSNSNCFCREPFDDMIAGMRADAVEHRRIATREDLEEYAYQVAGTVGLMLLPLLLRDDDGDNDDGAQQQQAADAAREPAIALGKAIQLINILRDASADAALGRIYLPRDELSREGVDEEDVLRLRQPPPEGYRTVVKSVAQRADELLLRAEEGKGTLPGIAGPLFVQLIVELYRGYLERLETAGYNNLSPTGERVKIGAPRKLLASVRALGKLLFEQ